MNPKRRKFAQEYVKDCNGTQAAIRAGYSPRTAEQQADQLLGILEVEEEVARLQEKAAEAAKVEAVDVLRELARIGFSDIGSAFDADGAILPLKEMPENVRRCISSIEVESLWDGEGKERFVCGKVHKFKFWDKPRALEQLGKHLELFTEVMKVKADTAELGDDDLRAILEVYERAKQRQLPADETEAAH
jgi:phage terminase small subunit